MRSEWNGLDDLGACVVDVDVALGFEAFQQRGHFKLRSSNSSD